MKKYLKSLVVIIMAILITGCGKEEIIKTCRYTNTDTTNEYKVETEYKIYAKDDIVEKTEIVETVISEDNEKLKGFKEYLENTYSEMKENYGGYKNEIITESGKFISKTTVDYNKINLDLYIKDNAVMKKYVNKDNKLLLNGVLELYDSLGYTCE